MTPAQKKILNHNWYLANKQKLIVRAKKWAADNPGQAVKHNKKSCLKYYYANKAKIQLRHNKWRNMKFQEYRNLTLCHYGKRCACCGEQRIEFLCIDHINGNGSKHRAEIKGKYRGIYHWLVKNHFPDGFQCLCHNCNASKGAYGYCPHQVERGEAIKVAAASDFPSSSPRLQLSKPI